MGKFLKNNMEVKYGYNSTTINNGENLFKLMVKNFV